MNTILKYGIDILVRKMQCYHLPAGIFASLSFSYLFTYKEQTEVCQLMHSHFLDVIPCTKQRSLRGLTSSYTKRGDKLPEASHGENLVE